MKLLESGASSGLGLHPERYEVLDEVARGGMGVILRVRDKGFRRDLAMKVLQAQDGQTAHDSQRTSRFLEEAQVTGQLEHPGVVPVYEVGLDEERQLFFTMRLVKGKTFGEVIDLVHAERPVHVGGWTTTRALGVLLKVCETMAFAHDKGVVHRDLKPANVMVGRFGETYVMDWGLARVTGQAQRVDPDATMRTILTTARKDDSGSDSSSATMEGDVMGTPAYMPPEQGRGELDRLGPRTRPARCSTTSWRGGRPTVGSRGPRRCWRRSSPGRRSRSRRRRRRRRPSSWPCARRPWRAIPTTATARCSSCRRTCTPTSTTASSAPTAPAPWSSSGSGCAATAAWPRA
jgi:serine/threonine protein kinase